ncbi:D-alanyl-D-alanine carboxypeptidase/D-alanyl-D-alanine-endopeptidase [Shewanella olleyana]|uniref:D-alanyl-D-alanine carboxypeptidase/D-alanyl-D-alanine endopeptidase n=1 Tax=Shewanella olleyana TaxID=135626 RepID=UPI00200CBDC2|nr:D-alanyl-D-alanine carboxypeptidase/D-alanyl-D-alanine-endopeptidase [Shewanella olleyana]MCL1068377.1 D-alanyl-D-alanine carboxypeptidase/D-alanyl-D-alanine-endopeptidase [Shewanella olleyana]
MSFVYRALCLPLVVLTASFSVSAEDYLTKMMNIISPPQSQLAVSVWDVETQQDVYNLNDNTLMLPASIQKLITAVAASHQLGRDFRYRTQVTYDGEIQNEVLNGDLYFHFQGDPTLNRKHLNELIETLKLNGVNRVSGKVYLVAAESKQTRAPGWAWDDLGICYAAPVSNYIIDRNCVKASLSPADDSSTVSIKPIYPITMTSTATFDPSIDVKEAQIHFCELHMQRFDNNHYQLDGCYPGNKSIRLAIAVNDPSLYSQAVIADLLSANNIVYQHIETTSKINKQQTIIASHQSALLPELLKIMLQKSDNLIADSLLKQIGANYFYQNTHQTSALKLTESNDPQLKNAEQQHSQWQKANQNDGFLVGAKAIEHIMRELGLPFIEANIVDGSGLSRYNLITARQMMSLLQLIKNDQHLQYIENLLPISGQSGTLRYKKYFNQPPLKNEVAAKTGTMMGVENLAGYLNADNGKQYAFVIIENGLSPKAKKARLAPFSALLLQTINDLP